MRVAFHLKMARRAARAWRWRHAARHYQLLLAVDPNQPAGHLQLGHALKESGDAEGGLAAYRRAIAWSPHFVEAHYALGQSLKLLGNTAGAELAFLTTLRLRPSHEHARSELLAAGWSAESINQFVTEMWSLHGRALVQVEQPPQAPVMPAGLSRREQIFWKDLRGIVVGV